uniref:Uncharacterized protein n=1 Tax=Rhizophora mucronata TaxID=61149 RepID=A0A2P2NT17_RHIMU
MWFELLIYVVESN